MYTAELIFQRKIAAANDRVDEAVYGLLGALLRNGQILGENWPVAHSARQVRAFVSVPERTSLQRKRADKWVKLSYAELADVGLSRLRVTVLGRNADGSKACQCAASPAYILFTHYFSIESPLRCSQCFRPVPPYRIPHTSGHQAYQDVAFWQHTYRCCDTLWLGSTVGERMTYQQMTEIDSELTKLGRSCAKAIARRAQKRCYYYLMRYHGRSLASERRRRCPGCDRLWLLSEPWHALFDFRCDRCGLLSNIAWDI